MRGGGIIDPEIAPRNPLGEGGIRDTGIATPVYPDPLN